MGELLAGDNNMGNYNNGSYNNGTGNLPVCCMFLLQSSQDPVIAYVDLTMAAKL